MSGTDLVLLPPQPEGVAWPGDTWPEGEPPASVDLPHRTAAAFDPALGTGETLAVAVVHRGRLVAERYAAPDVGPDATLISWSMAKSMLHAAVGVCVREGLLVLDAPAPVPEWAGRDNPRSAITLDDLLTMRVGLDFAEDDRWHGAHWWADAGSPLGTFWANGYEGQRIVCVPAADLVVVRLGKSPSECRPALDAWRRDLAVAFAGATP